ncbi:MAG: class I SAM-dependent methyltransferase [Terriglobia bacterium]
MGAGKQRSGIEGASLRTGRTPNRRQTSPRSHGNSSQDFRRLYEGLSEALPADRIFFLNFGYAEPGKGEYGWLAKADRAEKYHFSLVRRVLDGVELRRRTVLEIGSGRGGNCRYLARYTDADHIFGIDMDEGNVQFCRRTHRNGNVTFVRGDAEHLPVREGAVDVVLSLASAHCCQDFSGFLAEARRVLKPGGVFCLADTWSFELLPLDWAARRKALGHSGFRVVREEDISEPVFAALQKKDGLPRCLRALATPATKEFLNQVSESMETVGLYLATAQCSYKLWRLQKP